MLVERATYSKDIESFRTAAAPAAATAPTRPHMNSAKHTKARKGAGMAAKTAPGPKYPKARKGYAAAHGLHRGGSGRRDALPPVCSQPPLDLDAADEGLIVFVQTTKCRRLVWRQIITCYRCALECTMLRHMRPVAPRSYTTSIQDPREARPESDQECRTRSCRAAAD